jgi:hypothetical protein
MSGSKRRKLWTWDLEAFSWDQVCCAVLMSEDGDVERLTGTPQQILASAAAHMLRVRGTYVAHYGGGYDVPLLLNAHKFQKIVLTGSNILSAEDGQTLKLRDSYPWFLCPLAKLGEAVGMAKGNVDRSALHLLTMKEILDYCENDCGVLLKGVQAAQAFQDSYGADRAWTAGSSAVSIMRALEPGTWAALVRHALPVDDVKEALQCVRGGRVECMVRGRVDPVWVYDIKSSYPARYATQPVGIGLRHAGPDDHECCVWRCQWVWPHRRLIPPALDDATMTGVGLCEAWLIDEEIDAFRSCGVEVKRLEGIAPQMILPLGQSFAREMFAAKESTGPARAFSKVWLNSLHGKLSEDPIKEAFTAWRPARSVGPDPRRAGRSWWRYFEVNSPDWFTAHPHAQPIAAAQILGRARVALWRIDNALQMAGWDVYYNDTDSVMTNCPPDKMPVPLGKELGQLALEGGPYTGLFLGPKAYLLLDADGKVAKQALKGIPLRSYANGVLDSKTIFREAERPSPSRPEGEKGTDIRLQVFETALRDPRGARCLKDGVTSFLRGLGNAESKDPTTVEHWRRAPFVRDVKPSGRGKVFATEVSAKSWAYLTSLEIAALEIVRALPMPAARWAARNEDARRYLLDSGFVLVSEPSGKPHLTHAGMAWLKKMGGGDLPPPVDDDDDLDDQE